MDKTFQSLDQNFNEQLDQLSSNISLIKETTTTTTNDILTYLAFTIALANLSQFFSVVTLASGILLALRVYRLKLFLLTENRLNFIAFPNVRIVTIHGVLLFEIPTCYVLCLFLSILNTIYIEYFALRPESLYYFWDVLYLKYFSHSK